MRASLAIENFLEMMSAERGAARNTLESYRRDLEAVAEAMAARGVNLAEAGADHVRSAIDAMAAEGFAATSQARRLSALRQFFRFLYSEGYRQDDPTGTVDAPKKQKPLPKIMSVENVTRLLDRAVLEADEPGGPADLTSDRLRALRLHALLETLYATGLRVSELVGLPVTVARTDHRFLLVRGKGSKERMVPLSPKAREALQRFLALRDSLPGSDDNPWLFPAFSESGHLARQVFARELKGLAARAGDCRPLPSRRTCFATPLPATCCRTALTCAPCSNCSAMPTFQRRKSIRMCLRKDCISLSASIIRLPISRSTVMRKPKICKMSQ